MNESAPKVRRHDEAAQAGNVSVRWNYPLDRLWLYREYHDGDEHRNLQIRLDPDGMIAIFCNRGDHHSTIQTTRLPYDEFFESIRKTFFPEPVTLP